MAGAWVWSRICIGRRAALGRMAGRGVWLVAEGQTQLLGGPDLTAVARSNRRMLDCQHAPFLLPDTCCHVPCMKSARLGRVLSCMRAPAPSRLRGGSGTLMSLNTLCIERLSLLLCGPCCSALLAGCVLARMPVFRGGRMGGGFHGLRLLVVLV